VDRLAPAVFVEDLRSEGVGMKACSESFEEMESTGEGRPEEGAREELLLMLEEARLFGI
jgi:predicted peroxiredoxin